MIKKLLLIAVLNIMVWGIFFGYSVNAQFPAWIYKGYVFPAVPTAEVGNSSERVTKGWFADFDSTIATIGTLSITNSVDPGPLEIATSTPNPTIRFKGDTNTGISWRDYDELGLMTGGTDRFIIDSSGNITLTGNLDIGGSATTTALSVGSNALVVKDNGKVGIGTGSPSEKLDVIGSISLGGADGRGIILYKSESTHADLAKITNVAEAGGDVGITFHTTTNGGSTLPERMRISHDGNVGIGTTTPTELLDVDGDIRTDNLKVNTANGEITYGYQLGASGGASTLRSRGSFYPMDDNSAMYFYVIPNNPSGTERTGFSMFATDFVADISNYERLHIGVTNSLYKIHSDESGTGSLRPLVIYADDSENQLYLDTNGNIGIGTTTPKSLLTLEGTTNPFFQIASSTNQSLLIMDANGNVGINTSTPALGSKFGVDGDVYFGDNLIVEGSIRELDPVHLSVYATSTQAIGDQDWTNIIWEVEAHAHNGFTITMETASTTILNTGHYQFHIDFFVHKTGGATQIVEAAVFNNNVILKNDANGQDCTAERTVNSNNETGHFAIVCSDDLDANDIITVKMYSNSGEAQLKRSGGGVTNGATARMVVEQTD